ncbi:hypothetical protein [Methylomonas albis]|uniref:DUF58 domain-containing protein n=2 Tax=Methylomonas albis TaxID=1854563 RepID=A0ABR9D2F2_9GAMM|nr:hypothetical protein [Methylomonas albis]CAD6880348.1 hypothetical protein [Methylomonas albis]
MRAISLRTFWQIWRLPLALGLTSAAGLAAALIGDGAWDAASWALLGLPAAVCGLGLLSSKSNSGDCDNGPIGDKRE